MQRVGMSAASVVIDANGHPLDVQITRSSGSSAFDDMMRHAIESQEYLPQMMDGFPKAIVLHIRSGPPTMRP